MSRLYRFIFLLAIVRFFLPYLLQHSFYQLHRDEFLYLDYARQMQWGFMEVPPLLGVFAWLTSLADSPLWLVKFWPALLGSVSFALCADMAVRLGGRYHAICWLWISFIFGAFIRLFFLFQPGFLEVFTWTLMVWCLVRFQQSGYSGWLYGFGFSLGLAMLSKYTTLFFAAALVGGLLLTNQKKIWYQKHFIGALALAGIIWLPNLWWQYKHHFPVVTHMKELQETQLQYLGMTDFLAGQLIMLLVVAWLWIAGLLVILLSNFRAGSYRWYGVTFLLLLALLIIGRGKDYYAIGGYPFLLVVGSVQAEKWLNKTGVWIRGLAWTLTLTVGLFILPLGLPMFTPEKLADYYEKTGIKNALGFKWEDQQNHPLPQDFSDMIGWRELAEITAKSYNKLPDSIQQSTFIFCRGYYSAGALNYYGRQSGLPEAYTENGSYLMRMPDSVWFKNLLLVGHSAPESSDTVFNFFEKSVLLDSLNYPLFRENGIKLRLFINGNDSMRYYATRSIQREKKKFGL